MRAKEVVEGTVELDLVSIRGGLVPSSSKENPDEIKKEAGTRYQEREQGRTRGGKAKYRARHRKKEKRREGRGEREEERDVFVK